MNLQRFDPVDDRLIILVREGKTIREMSEDVNKAVANVHERLGKLVEEGMLVHELEEGKAKPYRITPAGETYLQVQGFTSIQLFSK